MRRRLSPALATALVLLALFEVGVARRDWFWDWNPQSACAVLPAIERQVVRPAREPRVVLLGSSRIRDAVAPRQLERELGLPEGSVLNLGLTGGTAFDSLALYRRNRDILGQADLLLIGVEDWYCNGSLGLQDGDRRFLTLSERWSYPEPDRRPGLVLGWFWRTFDCKGPMMRFFESLVNGRAEQLRFSQDGRISWRKRELEVGPTEVNLSDPLATYYGNFTPSRTRLAQLEELARLAREDGVRPIFLHVPLRDGYVDLVQARQPERLAEVEAALASLPEEHLYFQRASQAGLEPEDYYDYGHLTGRGARRFTAFLARRL